MYKTKKDVDKHVENLLCKVPTKEFKNRAYSIANLYFNVGDYTSCQKYVEQYLTQKDNNAAAYKLLGQAFLKLGQKEKALEQYKTSLDIDPTHTSTILDICQLLVEDDMDVEPGRVKYWSEKAEATFPRHPITFRLREKLVAISNSDPEALVSLLNAELALRPKDATLHIRLIKHYLHTNKYKEAFEHVCKIEFSPNAFVNNIAWYEALADVLKQNLHNTDWLYQLILLTVRERICFISLSEIPSSASKSLVESNELLHEYDQALELVTKEGAPSGFGEFHSALLQHHRGQFTFHAATFLLKKAKKDQLNWRDATKSAAPLMLIAYHVVPINPKVNWLKLAPEKQSTAVNRWYSEANYRCSQTGHYLLLNLQDKSQAFLDQISQCCSGTHWRDKLYEKVFPSRNHLAKIKTSHFVSKIYSTPVLRLPRKTEVEEYDNHAQKVHGNSLHHFIWTLINYKNYAHFKCTTFDMLTSSTISSGPESLNKIDIQAFLYCAALTAQQKINTSTYIITDKPSVLPANITNLLCTLPQMKWWDCAYKFSHNELGTELTDIRSTLSRGIEVVRCVDNHGLDPLLLCSLGEIFNEKAQLITNIDEKSHLEERAFLYYASAIPLLEKVKSKMVIKIPNKRMFDYTHKDPSTEELTALIEQSKLFVAIKYYHENEMDKVIELLSNIKSIQAYYYLSQTYKKIALAEKKLSKDSTTKTEAKCVALLFRAKALAFEALDKFKEVGSSKSDPMYLKTQELVEDIATELNMIEHQIDEQIVEDDTNYLSDLNNSYENMPMKTKLNIYQDISSTPKPIMKSNTSKYRTAIDTQLLESTRMDHQYLERIECEMKNLQKRDININDFMEQIKICIEENNKLEQKVMGTINCNIQNMTDQFQLLKISLDQVKDKINECTNDCKDIGDLKKQIAELKKEVNKLKKCSSEQTIDENDLYNLDEEYRTNDTTSNMTSQLPFNTPQVIPPFNQRIMPPFSVPPNPYQFYNQSLYNLYNHYSQFTQPTAVPGAPPIFDPARAQVNYSGMYPTPEQMYLDVAPLVTPLSVAPSVSNVQAMPAMPPLSVVPTMPNVPIVSVPPVVASISTSKSIAMEAKEVSRSLPVNVVITSSDPIPTCTSTPAPVLSVTIPSKHIKNTPHNYQIPMPSTNQSKVVSPPVFSFPISGSKTNTTTNSLSNWDQSSVFKYNQANSSQSSSFSDGSLLQNVSKGDGFTLNSSQTVVDGQFNKSSINTSLNKSRTLSERSNTSVDNYDPCPDFKPIVSLPAEVKVTTGEEDETVIFSSRAKLFRFVDKQWKERGLGEMKLLKHNVTGKVRVLMRREQIHKICANHVITLDMEIKPMKNETKAYFWVANDFADEVLLLEKFCIRFKTADIAHDFYETFEKARLGISNTTESKKNTGGLQTDKNITIVSPKEQSSQIIMSQSGKAKIGGFTFSSIPTLKPVQEDDKIEPKITEAPTSKVNIFSGLSLKTMSSSPFNNLFNAASALSSDSRTAQNQEAQNQLNLSETLEEFEPTAEFKPAIPLPALVEVKTGEEDEVVLFEHRAKLLRFDSSSKEWKERGLGNIKLLVHKDNVQKLRLLMRREQIMKVCCNHAVTKEMVFQKMPKSEKDVTWCAKDFSDGELVSETFCLRFKTVQLCDDFLENIKTAQIKMKDDSKAAKEERNAAKQIILSGFGDKFKPKVGSWCCQTCYTNNLESFTECACCEQPKLQEPGKDVTNVSNHENKIIQQNTFKFTFGVPVQTCGQTEMNPPITTHAATTVVTSSWGDKFKIKQGTWECKSCFVRNESNLENCCACNTSKLPLKKVGSEPVNLELPFSTNNMRKFNFGIPGQTATSSENTIQEISTSSTTVLTGWGDKFKPKEGTWECKNCFVRNESSSLNCCSCNNPKDGTTKSLLESIPSGNKFNFGIQSNMSIDHNSKQETTSIFDGTGTHKFNFGVPNAFNKLKSGEPFSEMNSNQTLVFGSQKIIDGPQGSTQFGFKKTNEVSVLDPALKPALLPTPQKDNTSLGMSGKDNGTFDFVFKLKTPPPKGKSPMKSPKSEAADESDDSLIPTEEDQVGYCFTPVMPLPDKVEVVTGEEDENELYGHRAKLYRFSSGEWKERGIGTVKILKHKVTGRLRLKYYICLNHALKSEITYIPKDDKTWLFAANDFSEGEFSLDQFCLRFKSKEIALEFKEAVGRALAGDTERTCSADSKSQKINNPDDVIFVSEIQATLEEKQKAKELMLPENFYTYKNKNPCEGCIGCKGDDDETTDSSINIATDSSSVPVNLSTPAKTEKSIFLSPSRSFYGTPGTLDKTLDTSIFRTPLGSIGSVAKSETPPSNKDNTSNNDVRNKENTFVQNTISNLPIVSSQTTILEKSEDKDAVSETSTDHKTSILAPPKLKALNISTQKQNVESKSTLTMTASKFGESKHIFGSVNLGAANSNNSVFGFSGLQSDNQHEVRSIFGGDQKPENLFSASFQGSIFGPGALNTNKTKAGDGILGSQNLALGSGKSIFGTTAQDSNSKLPCTDQISSDDKSPDVANNNKADKLNKNEEQEATEIINNDFVTFADLSSSGPSFTANPNFQWEGAGQQLFTTSRNNVESDKNESGQEPSVTGADEEYDPHYEPIVPLPDKIVVVTGEEDEEKMFGERCKLYRYDDKSREWKERGVGELKVLYHPERNTYRLLLRREQVHKAVLNMLLFMDLELLPLKNSDRAWTWAGRNYAETPAGEQETLAVRFKSIELATTFHDKVVECVRKLQAAAAQSVVEEKKVEMRKFEGVTPLRLPKHLDVSARADGTLSAKVEEQTKSALAAEKKVDSDTKQDEEESKPCSAAELLKQVHFEEQDDEDYEDDDDEDDEEGYYYNEDEEDSGVCFSGEGEAVVRQGATRVTTAHAHVMVLYDQELYSPKIIVTDSATGEILADMLIHTETEFQMNGETCSWSGADYTSNNPVEKTVTVKFYDSEVAMQFYDNCETSKASTYPSTDPES
ncbi:hypothetical protein K1T71_003356 [Dendrolimus kikuchii]|uniref:Uncharacterized protein n=1 Tax=Dendrolimus kikuchii TaxID=765133 RepID=A0ACC1DBK5_9NEOP|nr:hypothetical protein K1T71_003356 [Dendrolimus kikuchii]